MCLVIINQCLYGTLGSNMFPYLMLLWQFRLLKVFACFFGFFFLNLFKVVSFLVCVLLQSCWETLILGNLPLLTKLWCGLVTVASPLCLHTFKGWAHCSILMGVNGHHHFHVFTRKPTYSCAETKGNTEVWMHCRKSSHFKGSMGIS